MLQGLHKIPFILELFFNGSFILLFSGKSMGKIPAAWNKELITTLINAGGMIVPLVLLLSVVVNYVNAKSMDEFFRKHIFSIVVFIPLLITWGDVEFSFWLGSAHLLSSVLSLYDEGGKPKSERGSWFSQYEMFKGLKLGSAQLVLLSFSGVILIGTFLLMLPVSTTPGKVMSFIDALFMATSATCVTGLSTMSLENDFSLFGQIVILILIQVGGLSIMTLYASMALLMGNAMGMKERMNMQEILEVASLEELFSMIVSIMKYTFFIELWGAIVLTIGFTFEGYEFGSAIYYGFFHSISAFCNAGFALFDTSLESYSTKPLIHGTIMVLITMGGLGFIVIKELKEVVMGGKSIVRLGLHSKVVIVTSFILTIAGALFIFFGEFLHALDSYTVWEKVQISLFQSITLRTAGFSSIPLTNLNTYTLYAMTLFMFIGGSPGSTAGGIKTTTLAILYQSIKATLKGEKSVGIIDRKIPGPLVVRATAITFISIIVTSIFILVLMRLESDQGFLAIFFEVISASGTVGLSLGITPVLSVMGKIAIAALMLIGRIGPLTLLLAIAQRERSTGKFDYPDGRIMIG